MIQDHCNEVEKIINEALDHAEETWNNGGSEIVMKAQDSAIFEGVERAEVVPSLIPGHPIVSDGEVVIDEFVVLVADMRDSSGHLMQAISSKIANVSQLERVYYETTALLPAMAKAITYENGQVTEYLGDGLLAMFRVDKTNRNKALYASRRAALSIVMDVRNIVNKILKKRYRLPELDLGVGLALSRSLVTLVGLHGEKQPKIFGESVYRATKLSGGYNQVVLDTYLRKSWPRTKGGKVSFKPTEIKKIKGYILEN